MVNTTVLFAWPSVARPRTYCLADSDEESSSAGSSDEEDTTKLLADKAAILPGGEGWAHCTIIITVILMILLLIIFILIVIWLLIERLLETHCVHQILSIFDPASHPHSSSSHTFWKLTANVIHDTHTHTHTLSSPWQELRNAVMNKWWLWLTPGLSSLLLLLFLCLRSWTSLAQVRGRPPAQQDHALCGQDRQVQVLPEGHGDRVHQEEDWGDVQHAPAAHCGGAGVSWDAGRQHPSAPHRQDMVVVGRIIAVFIIIIAWRF